MKCASKDAGCGARAAYGDYLKGAGGSCDHMRTKSAVRHFANPALLGGGHPAAGATGLAEADAQVLRQASMLVERASEQAGPPNIPATEWEQLLAQVLLCAGGS